MGKRAIITLMGLAVLVFGVTLAACSADDPILTETTGMTDVGEEGGDHMDGFAFGEPADAADADRVIEISATDGFAFDPDSASVSVGETVTFRVTNIGVIPHDFTLGDKDMQDEHEMEMQEMGDGMAMHEEPNVFSLEPGETKEMTWHFTSAAALEFGCHQAGHYAAGMHGSLSVEG